MKIVIELTGEHVTMSALRRISESADCCLSDGGVAISAEVVGVVVAEDSPGDQLIMAVKPMGDFPIVCDNGCPEGYLGRHKFSCSLARPGVQR